MKTTFRSSASRSGLSSSAFAGTIHRTDRKDRNMNRRLLSLLALVFATGLTTALVVFAQNAPAQAPAAGGGGGGGGAAAGAGGTPIRIAICNPARIFQDMQETNDLRQSMEAEGKTF